MYELPWLRRTSLSVAADRSGHLAAVQCLRTRRSAWSKPSNGCRSRLPCASNAGWCRPRTTPAPTACSTPSTPISVHSPAPGWPMPSVMWPRWSSASALTADSRVVEIAANDGYLLQYVAGRGIACLGVEPTRSTAQAAREKGLEIREAVLRSRNRLAQLVSEGWSADLMAANNVLAHVPDINDFLAGFATLLKPTGVATFEFPQLLTLMAGAAIRHPVSRALFLSVPDCRADTCASAMACTCSTSARSEHPWRLVAGVCAAHGRRTP